MYYLHKTQQVYGISSYVQTGDFILTPFYVNNHYFFSFEMLTEKEEKVTKVYIGLQLSW